MSEKNQFKMLPFYRLHDWMIDELGLSTDAAIVAVIHSFHCAGRECVMTYEHFEKLLRCTRCTAIARIGRLIDAGYLVRERRDGTSNIYRVNYDAFKMGGMENDTPGGMENDTPISSEGYGKQYPGGIENNTPGGMENDTPGVSKTIPKYRKEKRTEQRTQQREDGCAVTLSESDDFVLLGSGQNVKLSKKQYEHLKFGTQCCKGKSIEYYIQIASKKISEGKKYRDVYASILKWILEDGGCEYGEAEEKRNREAAPRSSIDLAEADRLMKERTAQEFARSSMPESNEARLKPEGNEARAKREAAPKPHQTSDSLQKKFSEIQMRESEWNLLQSLDLAHTGKTLEDFLSDMCAMIRSGDNIDDQFTWLRQKLFDCGARIRSNA